MKQIENTLKLLEAGFTADEIRTMAQAAPEETDKAAKAGDDNPPSKEAEDKGAPESTASDTSEEARAWLKDITKELDEHISNLRKAYERYNVIASSNEKPKQEQTGVQALASLVAPSAIYQKGDKE